MQLNFLKLCFKGILKTPHLIVTDFAWETLEMHV